MSVTIIYNNEVSEYDFGIGIPSEALDINYFLII